MQAQKFVRGLFFTVLGAAIGSNRVIATTYFVNSAAGPGGSGLSWQSAFQHLEDSLSLASSGDQVWVAKGTYKPAEKSASFIVPLDVNVFGGFIGTETVLSQRNKNPLTNGTVLTGDLEVPNSYLDNCYTVVVFSSGDSTGALDGFTVTGGNGIYAEPDRGAGIHLPQGSSPTIANCRIVGNRLPSGAYGAGLYVSWNCQPQIEDCIFEDNRAGHGGAVYVGYPDPRPTFRRCLFKNNIATDVYGGSYAEAGGGGAIFNDSYHASADTGRPDLRRRMDGRQRFE